MHPILGFVGPSGVGKTTLMLELLNHVPDKVIPLKSLTTRPRRGPEDDVFYTFTTKEDIQARKQTGKIFSFSEYAENFYAFDREQVDKTLNEKIGLQALVENSLDQIHQAGYELIIIKVVPKGKIDQRSKEREIADIERAQTTHYTPDLIVENSFEPNGLQEATQTILTFMKEQNLG